MRDIFVNIMQDLLQLRVYYCNQLTEERFEMTERLWFYLLALTYWFYKDPYNRFKRWGNIMWSCGWLDLICGVYIGMVGQPENYLVFLIFYMSGAYLREAVYDNRYLKAILEEFSVMLGMALLTYMLHMLFLWISLQIINPYN
jgi:hypothetical protein